MLCDSVKMLCTPSLSGYVNACSAVGGRVLRINKVVVEVKGDESDVRVVFDMYDADVFPNEPFKNGKLRGNKYVWSQKWRKGKETGESTLVFRDECSSVGT